MAQLAGDLSLAEDCAQEACAAAVEKWRRDGLPASPGGWVVAVARRRALDHLRRESARAGKEREAVQEWAAAGPDGATVAGDDQLALLFACCHPALDPASRVTLTLRVVCGLPTASIAACHADAATAAGTDWRQIALLYSELLRFGPSPVIEANRAVAVACAEGPAAGLAILGTLTASSRLARWPQLHIARGALLAQCGRPEDAVTAYRDALALEPAPAVRQHITGQIAALGAAHEHSEET